MKKILVFLFISFLCVNLFAQDDNDDIDLTNFNQDKISAIEVVKNNLIQTKNIITAKENELAKTKDKQKKAQLQTELNSINKRYDKLKLNLISTITNIKIDELETPVNAKRDYIQEIQELLGPAFDTIQRISERPRKIEALRKQIQIYNQKLLLTQSALKNIDVVENSKDFQSLLPDIQDFLDDASYNVDDLNQEYKLKVDRLNHELSDLTKDDKSLLQAFTDLLKQFFKERGKHLSIAAGIFILVIWILGILKNKFLYRLDEKKHVEWFYKPISALYGFLTILISLSLFILSLYLMGDWVLFTLTILFLSMVLWSSKNYIHKYLEQGRLILNLGTIKEGELIIYRDIPFKVKNINFVTTFENDYLDSSIIRVEISQIYHMHSRKILPNELWFPSRTNDWVMLSDGTYGQIKQQTVEQIVIEIRGNEKKFYTTTDYLSLRPVNLSHGYTLELVWNLDYNDAKSLINVIIPRFKEKLADKIKQHSLAPKDYSLDFHSAGSSSLNIVLYASFAGDQAAKRYDYNYLLNRILFEITIEENLNIPFNQIVVHQNLNQ